MISGFEGHDGHNKFFGRKFSSMDDVESGLPSLGDHLQICLALQTGACEHRSSSATAACLRAALLCGLARWRASRGVLI